MVHVFVSVEIFFGLNFVYAVFFLDLLLARLQILIFPN